VEASKASSGNLAVNFEKVDLHELVLQAQENIRIKWKNQDLIYESVLKIIIFLSGPMEGICGG